MKWPEPRQIGKLSLIAIWLVFTLAFALWWLQFSVEHVGLLGQLQPERSQHWLRQERMILWEGTTWIVLLALGGGALFVLVLAEMSRAKNIRQFFASFSHEVKTSLASLRLQAEALQNERESSPILDRLIGDTVRLQIQLENSLFLASQEHLKLYMQDLDVKDLVARLREQWPALDLRLFGDGQVRADERALATVLSNLLQNSILHGRAQCVQLELRPSSSGRVEMLYQDDGIGFEGSLKLLGRLFHRPTPESGSGLGLFICRLLVEKMGGQLRLEPSRKGFFVRFELNGSIS